MRAFPFGPAPLVMAILAVVSGGWLIANQASKKSATLRMWTFAKPHYEAYQKALPKFLEENPGVSVDLQLVEGNGLNQRLRAAFQADLDVPDMVEIEISAAGSFFRGPKDHIGFLDLTDRLKNDGLMEKIVASRFAPYTNRGSIYGLPHDVHPVMLAYNREKFKALGIDAEKLDTWEKFIEAGKRVRKPGERYLLEMSDTGGSQLELALFQRDGGYFDAEGKVIFDNPVGVETMKWYVPLVAKNSKDQIGNALSSSFGQVMTQALETGYFLSVVTPDWRSKSHETDVGKLSGKMGLMPLPAVKPGGRRTSTWGGTMLGIARSSKSPDLAWKLAKHLYLSEKDLAERFADTNILPPVPAAWKEPAFDRAYDYYAGQRIGRDYANLAPQVPSQYASPFVDLAKGKLSEALIQCVEYYNASGADAGWDAFVNKTLKDRADEVRKQMERNPF
jgi:arabinosaccharide transport system substrate-binding protein